MNLGNGIKIGLAAILSTAAQKLGGWDTALQTLVLFMATDYMTGLVVAAVFKTSPKTDTGTLESKAGFKGLFRKGAVLLVVLIGTSLDMLMDTGELVRNATIIGFTVGELISILENIGLMGVDLPPVITQAIDVLKKKGDEVKLP
ncbi:phage holin family protein [Alkaliphilus crotonatoxidans]